MGAFRLTNQPAQFLDIGNRWSYTEMDAILGMDLLRRQHAVIDFLGRGLFLRAEKPAEKTIKLVDASLRHSGWIANPTTEGGLCNFVQTYIRAEPLRFLVDSGCNFTQLDLKVARRLGYERKEMRMTVRGVEDRASKSSSTWIPLIGLPGFALTNQPVLVADLTAWQPKHGRQIDGVIGADWLAVGESVIDCETGVLYLRHFPKSKK